MTTYHKSLASTCHGYLDAPFLSGNAPHLSVGDGNPPAPGNFEVQKPLSS
ncbi:MAG: hypothetical protein IPP40_16780 [bacterium]|nr:hypothetical protein [bacterium]